MKSPFPGMDPYLESRWGDVHARFMVYACDAIASGLPPNLIAHVEEYMAVQSGDESERISSDIRVEELPTNGMTEQPTNSSGVAIADPLVVPTALPRRTLRSIRILDPDSGNRIVTAVEVLSRSNKVGRAGREDYERKQRELLEGGANLVELDFLRAGGHVLAVPYDNFPNGFREPYRICVVRASARHQGEIYRAAFRQRLPVIRIPLRPKDSDVLLDLQPLIDVVYERGRYARLIDYGTEPTPRLDPEDAAWADELLRKQGKR
jgi:Protein of unknown function (DUF4058)